MHQPGYLWRLWLSTLFIGLILSVAGWLISTLMVLLLTFAGVLFAIFLHSIGSWISDRTSLTYPWSYTMVVLFLAVLAAAGFQYLGYQIAQQAAELWSQLKTSLNELMDRVREYEWAQQYLPDFRSAVSDGSVLPKVMSGMQSLAWGITGALVILFVGLYVAYDPDLYKNGLIKLVPPHRRERAAEVLQQLYSTLQAWMLGRLISMAIIGVFTSIALWLLDVPLPFALGVVAALLTFVPNIGPVLAAVPQALLALEVGTSTAVYVILFNIALQGVESYLITPMVQKYEVSLPPALTIFAQLLMGIILGVIGIMVAAPMTAASMVLVRMLYLHEEE